MLLDKVEELMTAFCPYIKMFSYACPLATD
jgi:hypothetical protein